MNILFCCHRLPFPPKRGGKIRPFNIIRHLTESGHNVTVASLARSDAELDEGSGLEDFCGKLLVGRIKPVYAIGQMVARMPLRSPSSMGYFYSRELHRLVRTEAERTRFDLVFVHCSSAAQYARHVRNVPSILDFGDMDSQKWLDYSTFRGFPLSIGYWLEGTKLSAEEKRLAGTFEMCTCTTEAEFQTLNDFRAAHQTDWFPNGVDSELFSPTDKPYDPNLICFVGRMDYYPNQQAMLSFCSDVLPRLQQLRPDVELIIVGAEPSKGIRDLANRKGVTVTGTVPDVRDHVRQAALTVAPLSIARGTQNKILESMAMAVPVVASELAARGVDAVPEEHLLTASSPDEYVSSIVRILDDPGERRRLSVAGRERVLAAHDWAASTRRLDRTIERVIPRVAVGVDALSVARG